MILLINAVPIATVLKEIYIKYRFKMDEKTNESIYVRFCARFMIQYISENSIRIILPVIEQNLDKLTTDEKKIYDILQFKALPSRKLVEYTGFGKTKVLQIVNKLVNSGFLRKQGIGRGTTYTVK